MLETILQFKRSHRSPRDDTVLCSFILRLAYKAESRERCFSADLVERQCVER